MKVSGFTFIRNGVKFDYPVVESIKSILPVCDEVVVAVGNSDDDTLGLIRKIDDPKIKIIETVWDNSLREGGRVLAVETNKALDAISPDSDWAFYAQADEVFHEKDYAAMREGMEKYLNDKRVQALLFRHINFYGSYDYTADSHKWMKNEIRIIRNDKNIRSWSDAMSFRTVDDKLLRVKMINAMIYHYGWVKPPEVMQEKLESFNKMWHDDDYMENNFAKVDKFDYSKIDSLAKFEGTHPAVMQERVKRMNWQFSFDPTKSIKLSPRLRLINWIEKNTGLEIGRFKNYKLLK